MAIRSIDALKLAQSPRPDGDLHGNGMLSSRSRISWTASKKLGADAVHLVDEADPGNLVLGRLPPDGLALGLDPLDGREDDDRAVEHAQRPLDLGREVDVAGGVDDVDRDRRAQSVVPAAGIAAATIVMPRSCSSSR